MAPPRKGDLSAEEKDLLAVIATGEGINVYLKEGCQDDGARLFPVVPSSRTQCKGQKLMHRKFHLNKTKKFFTVQLTTY